MLGNEAATTDQDQESCSNHQMLLHKQQQDGESAEGDDSHSDGWIGVYRMIGENHVE